MAVIIGVACFLAGGFTGIAMMCIVSLSRKNREVGQIFDEAEFEAYPKKVREAVVTMVANYGMMLKAIECLPNGDYMITYVDIKSMRSWTDKVEVAWHEENKKVI